jgi:hypothetical protein
MMKIHKNPSSANDLSDSESSRLNAVVGFLHRKTAHHLGIYPLTFVGAYNSNRKALPFPVFTSVKKLAGKHILAHGSAFRSFDIHVSHQIIFLLEYAEENI